MINTILILVGSAVFIEGLAQMSGKDGILLDKSEAVEREGQSWGKKGDKINGYYYEISCNDDYKSRAIYFYPSRSTKGHVFPYLCIREGK
jgi:hypothetical protein